MGGGVLKRTARFNLRLSNSIRSFICTRVELAQPVQGRIRLFSYEHEAELASDRDTMSK